ncbi:hypothetical protein ACHAQJ_003826 [Trichoderma viride]
MALVIGLVAAAARAMSGSGNDHDRQNYSNGGNPGYNGNDQYHNNNGYNNGYSRNGYSSNGYNNSYDTSPYAAYPPQGLTGGRRSSRRSNRRMRKAERTDMVMSLIHSRSRAGPQAAAVPVQPQPVSGGVPYMNYGGSPMPRAVYSSESQGPMAGSYTSQMPPPGGPEGYRWRDEQSRDRPVSRQMGSASSSTDGLPTYEEAVHRSGKSSKP